jgi:hypothetical protein
VPSAAPAGTLLTNFTVTLNSGCGISLVHITETPVQNCGYNPTSGYPPQDGGVVFSADSSGSYLITDGSDTLIASLDLFSSTPLPPSYANCLDPAAGFNRQAVVAAQDTFCVSTAQTITAITVQEENSIAVGGTPFVVLEIETWKYLRP